MAWKEFDLQAEIARLFPWPIHFCNDASAACAAELLFGRGRELQDFAYFYLGYFIGGGIVLNGSLYLGRQRQCRGACLLPGHLRPGHVRTARACDIACGTRA